MHPKSNFDLKQLCYYLDEKRQDSNDLGHAQKRGVQIWQLREHLARLPEPQFKWAVELLGEWTRSQNNPQAAADLGPEERKRALLELNTKS